jgi:hypothetical protein
MEYDKLKCTHVSKSKTDTSLTSDDDDEGYSISDGQLLTHIVGEVSEVVLDDTMFGSCYRLKATARKSRASSFKRSAWPNKKARESKFNNVSK